MGNWSSAEPEWVPQTYNFREEHRFPGSFRLENTRNFYEEEDEEWSPFSSSTQKTQKPIYLQTERKIGMRSYTEDCLRDRKLLSQPQNQVRENWSITEPKRVPQTYHVREGCRFAVPRKLPYTGNLIDEDDQLRQLRSHIKRTLIEKNKKLKSYTDYREQNLCLNQPQKQVPGAKLKCQENLLLSDLESLAGLSSQFKNLSIADEKRLPTPKRVKFNPAIIKDFLKNTGYEQWCGKVNNYSPYILDILENDTVDFSNIERLFKRKNYRYFQVTSIEKLYNPYLLMQYKLKSKQYSKKFGCANEKVLFHGTKLTNKDGICNFNFDWRLNGRHKFGQGVSFASVSSYATHYADKPRRKIMFIVDVLVNKHCLGNPDTILPPMMCDTTTNNTRKVLVKYEDNEFYPSYVVHYEQVKAKRKHYH